MSGLEIDLSSYTDRFASDSLKLTISKKVNFIFGKNGTGKTTIADEIDKQFSDKYDVCVFKDFNGVAENNELNAVALGTENSIIQKKIDIIDNEIIEIKKQIEKPEVKDYENLFTTAEKAKFDFENQYKKIDNFHTLSAQQIKNITNPSIAKTSYDKNDFIQEIPKANLLQDADVDGYKKTIKADKKTDIGTISLPSVNLNGYIQSTNEVLISKVEQSQLIPELKDSPAKQSFAKRGMEIHDRKPDEACAFCGNNIDEKRWVALGNYFNDEVKKFETRIQNGIQKVNEMLKGVSDTKEIDENIFYEKYRDQVKKLNLEIELRKKEYKEFFEQLKSTLEDKKNKLFVKVDVLQVAAKVRPADANKKKTATRIVVPQDFSNIQTKYNKLAKDNNDLSSSLKSEQEKAKDALRYHEIKKRLDKYKYTIEHGELERLGTINSIAKTNFEGKKTELENKQKDRSELISQTKDEEVIAGRINDLLKGMGVTSFSLKPVNCGDEKQKGQYQIKGHNGSIRPITELSKGEKNIIAFLYFLFSLEKVDSIDKPKIIVLDDPMTSNDDTMQYLMIGEIQKFYRNLQDNNYLILLTHNCHFYLNVRPNTAIKYKENDQEISFYEKYGTYHLFSDGKCAKIKGILKGKQDFKTSYEILWKELAFLYEASEATPDLMLGPCRKICETYMNFTKKGLDTFYGENLSAKKLFDVNHHSIDDLEAEQNGKTKVEIKDILQNLFKQNNADEHFNNYWKGNSS